MGTLKNQLPRMEHLKDDRVICFADRLKYIALQSDITYLEALETFKSLALIDDYDTKDEQLSGIADTLFNMERGTSK